MVFFRNLAGVHKRPKKCLTAAAWQVLTIMSGNLRPLPELWSLTTLTQITNVVLAIFIPFIYSDDSAYIYNPSVHQQPAYAVLCLLGLDILSLSLSFILGPPCQPGPAHSLSLLKRSFSLPLCLPQGFKPRFAVSIKQLFIQFYFKRRYTNKTELNWIEFLFRRNIFLSIFVLFWGSKIVYQSLPASDHMFS